AAAGGGSTGYGCNFQNTGKGGYSVGTIYLYDDDTVSVYVGGGGSFGNGGGSVGAGGWNGGGSAKGYNGSTDVEERGAGGGASDVRINGDTLNERVIVAGGGGGGGRSLHTPNSSCNWVNAGSGGGGLTDTSGATTQTSGYSPGVGISYVGQSFSYGFSGGGGGWWGGRTYAGGSGYIGGVASYGDILAETIAANLPFPNTTGGSETGHAGNGYARITPIDQPPNPTVLFGSAVCGDVVVVSATELTCTVPASPLPGDKQGSVNVVVQKAAGTATLSGGYQYNDDPEIISIDPDVGSMAGGQTVEIVGRDFMPTIPTTATTMQQMTWFNCTYMMVYDGTNPAVLKTLTDPRNGQAYLVGKLADNNCWMLNNLKIRLSDVNTADHALSDPNVNFAALGAVSAPDNGTSSSNMPDPTYTAPAYYDPNCSVIISNIIGNGCDNSGGNLYSSRFYGYLYNWCAAMGATVGVCTAENTAPADLDGNAAGSGYDALNTASICPAGWRLPTGDVDGDFSNLDVAFGGTGTMIENGPSVSSWLFNGGFRGVFSGTRQYGFFEQGSYGFWWSSSAVNSFAGNSFITYVAPTAVYPATMSLGTIGTRRMGYAVRCMMPGGVTPAYPDVTFDGDAAEVASAVQNPDGTQTLTVITPAHAVAELVDVAVTNSWGGVDTVVDGYEYIDVYLSLSVSPNDVALTVSPDGGVAADYTVANVDTNNPNGYRLTLEATEPDLVCDSDGQYTIPSIVSDGALAAPVGAHGAWAWNVVLPVSAGGLWPAGVPDAPTSWRVVPVGVPAVMANTSARSGSAGDDYGLYFGATADWGQPACSAYRRDLTITALGN
ncbi:MAG: IPT/TIG domain-containing protein, partial [Candidatus Nomurabacteria bacterium]|nr:IPT/TIG domain-containing protein [Candidatus Nomurabacteria bacterium]